MTEAREKRARTSKAAATTASRMATSSTHHKADSKHGAAELPLENHELHGYIQEAAYLKAEARDFEPGFELQDWLEAESELNLNEQLAMDKPAPKSERAQHRTYKSRGAAANG